MNTYKRPTKYTEILPNADFNWELIDEEILILEDLQRGGETVLHEMGWIYQWLEEEHEIYAYIFDILLRDHQGWFEYTEQGKNIPISASNKEEAVKAFRKRKRARERKELAKLPPGYVTCALIDL